MANRASCIQPETPVKDARFTRSVHGAIVACRMSAQNGTINKLKTGQVIFQALPEIPTVTGSNGILFVLEDSPTDQLVFVDNEGTSYILNKADGALFDVLSVGNTTQSLDIDLTNNSEIISSDGDVRINAETSSGSGNIVLKPKVTTGVIQVEGSIHLDGLLRKLNLRSGASIVSSNANIELDTLSSTGVGDINIKAKNLFQIHNDVQLNGVSFDLTSGSSIISSDGDIEVDASTSSGTGNLNFRPKNAVNFYGNVIIQPSNTIDLRNASSIISSDGDVTIDTTASTGTGFISLRPKGGSNVQIVGNLDVTGTTTTVDSQNVLIQDNCIYLNNGYISTSAFPGCIVVNYLATANVSSVAVGGFTAGPGSGSGPTVETDNTYSGWVAGDIIQISGANNDTNNGLFEVESYSNPTLTIRGVGGTAVSFGYFQDDFVTDVTVMGSIRQIFISSISSGSDGAWEMSFGDSNSSTVSFSKIAPRLNSSGVGTHSLIFNAPNSTTKTLTAGSNITIVDSGTGNLTINSTGGGAGVYQEVAGLISPVSASVNSITSGTTNTINSFVTNSSIGASTSCRILGDASTILNNNGIWASTSSEIRTSGVGATGNRNSICSCSGSVIGGTTAPTTTLLGDGNSLVSCLTSDVDRGNYNHMCTSSDCRIQGIDASFMEYNSVFSSDNGIIRKTTAAGPGLRNSLISTISCTIGSTNAGSQNTIISCNTCTFNEPATFCSIQGSTSCDIIGTATLSGINSSSASDIDGNGVINCHILASDSSTINQNSGTASRCVVMGCLSCSAGLATTDGAGISNSIFASSTSNVKNGSTYSSVGASITCNIDDCDYSMIMASTTCTAENQCIRSAILASSTCNVDFTENCVLQASLSSNIIGTLALNATHNMISASTVCNIVSVTAAAEYDTILSSSNGSDIDDSTFSSIISSHSGQIINTAIYSALVGQRACTLNRADHCMIHSSLSSSILSPPVTKTAYSTIGSSNSCTIGDLVDEATYASIFSSNNCRVDDSDYCSIHSSVSSVIDLSSVRSSIVSCFNCDIFRGVESSIQSSNVCNIFAPVATTTTNSFIAASNNCDVGSLGIAGGSYHTILSSLSTILSNASSTYLTYIAGVLCTNTSAASYSCAIGSRIDLNHSGNFAFSDNAGGTRLATSADHQFNVRASGGSTFYSNTLNTTGVTLAAGASAWAVVSDKNLKENFKPYDGVYALESLRKIPVYLYNFKGNPKEQVCIGPVSQDWHEYFGTENITSPVMTHKMIMDENGVEMVARDEENRHTYVQKTDEDGMPLFETKPAKNPKYIDQMDMMGVMMAAIKQLNEEIDGIESQMNEYIANISAASDIEVS